MHRTYADQKEYVSGRYAKLYYLFAVQEKGRKRINNYESDE